MNGKKKMQISLSKYKIIVGSIIPIVILLICVSLGAIKAGVLSLALLGIASL